MSPKNLSASKKTHKFLINKLKDEKTFQIYNKFQRNIKLDQDFIVAVSGGADSLALSFLSKIYSIKKSINVKYILVDHKLRKNSSKEADFVKKILNKLNTKLKILQWIGKKPKSNIQSVARTKRYNLLINEAKKTKINYILLGHHRDDLYENFFIRLLRGSGLKGLVSLGENSEIKDVTLLRPLLNFDKKELIYVSKRIFGNYIKDPSNEQEKFRRIKIRNLIKNLKFEGLDIAKFDLTVKNLKFANKSIEFFIKKNISENSTYSNKNKTLILNSEFFNNPEEVIFRSFSEVIKIVGKKFYSTRGKKITKIIELIKNKRAIKVTLGSCIIRKVNQTVIITKEH